MSVRCLLSFAATIALFLFLTVGTLGDELAYLSQPAYDEVRIDGRLSGILSSNSSAFTLLAEQVIHPDKRRVWLRSITTKNILLTAGTGFFVAGDRVDNVSYQDDGTNFYHITVVGTDNDAGGSLTARIVIVNRESDSDKFAFDHFEALSPKFALRPTRPQTAVRPVVPRIVVQPIAPQIHGWEQSIDVNGGTFDATIVAARLSTVTPVCGLAQNTVGSTEPLDSIARRYGAIAAINGSFFNSDNVGPIKMPDMPLVSRGNLVNFSNAGVLLGFTSSGEWRMARSIDVARMCGSSAIYQRGDDLGDFTFWSHVTEAVGCGPRLVYGGKIQIAVDTDRVNDSDVLRSRTLRSAVGITGDDHIIFVVVHRAGLADMAAIMAHLGCMDAMNMDGGSSSGLWLNGKSIVSPGRYLSNALLLVPRK